MAAPFVNNQTLILADTEYSVSIPDSVNKLSVQCRTSAAIRFAFTTGKVATPTEPYVTIKADSAVEIKIDRRGPLTSLTLYLASPSAGVVAEVLGEVG